jgi:proteasome accessory factor A
VIIGDANLSEVATFLKVGTTALVLCMVEDEFLPREWKLAAPVSALRRVSRDLSLREPLELADGSSATALEIQWEFFDRARKYADAFGLEAIGGPQVGGEVLRRWEAALTGLESDPMTLASTLDWVAKYRLLGGYRERHGLDWNDARLQAMDLQYHDLRPEKGLAARVGLERLVDEADVERAVASPPPATRAWFRGECLRRFPDAVVAANWDSLVFDIGGDPLRRVPMMEPLRGTQAMVGSLLDRCATAGELIAALDAAAKS